ncbi:hypothetical protein SeLEV6574_g02024 [Synchytrium endobioticum]|nr:hypothetical protein SeLEV6574_g02024 [Synchytrium endobioticum]
MDTLVNIAPHLNIMGTMHTTLLHTKTSRQSLAFPSLRIPFITILLLLLLGNDSHCVQPPSLMPPPDLTNFASVSVVSFVQNGERHALMPTSQEALHRILEIAITAGDTVHIGRFPNTQYPNSNEFWFEYKKTLDATASSPITEQLRYTYKRVPLDTANRHVLFGTVQDGPEGTSILGSVKPGTFPAIYLENYKVYLPFSLVSIEDDAVTVADRWNDIISVDKDVLNLHFLQGTNKIMAEEAKMAFQVIEETASSIKLKPGNDLILKNPTLRKPPRGGRAVKVYISAAGARVVNAARKFKEGMNIMHAADTSGVGISQAPPSHAIPVVSKTVGTKEIASILKISPPRTNPEPVPRTKPQKEESFAPEPEIIPVVEPKKKVTFAENLEYVTEPEPVSLTKPRHTLKELFKMEDRETQALKRQIAIARIQGYGKAIHNSFQRGSRVIMVSVSAVGTKLLTTAQNIKRLVSSVDATSRSLGVGAQGPVREAVVADVSLEIAESTTSDAAPDAGLKNPKPKGIVIAPPDPRQMFTTKTRSKNIRIAPV